MTYFALNIQKYCGMFTDCPEREKKSRKTELLILYVPNSPLEDFYRQDALFKIRHSLETMPSAVILLIISYGQRGI